MTTKKKQRAIPNVVPQPQPMQVNFAPLRVELDGLTGLRQEAERLNQSVQRTAAMQQEASLSQTKLVNTIHELEAQVKGLRLDIAEIRRLVTFPPSEAIVRDYLRIAFPYLRQIQNPDAELSQLIKNLRNTGFAEQK